MNQELTRTLRMKYSGKLELVTCPAVANYDEIIGIAVERFDIPAEFKDFLEISNGFGSTFQKDTFEYFLLLFPDPKVTFHIRVNYTGLLRNLREESPTRRTKKRRSSDRDEYVCAPLTRQNCFIGTWPESLNVKEEPSAKKKKTEVKSKAPVLKLKRTRSKKSFRI